MINLVTSVASLSVGEPLHDIIGLTFNSSSLFVEMFTSGGIVTIHHGEGC